MKPRTRYFFPCDLHPAFQITYIQNTTLKTNCFIFYFNIFISLITDVVCVAKREKEGRKRSAIVGYDVNGKCERLPDPLNPDLEYFTASEKKNVCPLGAYILVRKTSNLPNNHMTRVKPQL